MSLRLLSISQLSEVTGKDRRTITKRLAGVEPHSTEGRAVIYSAPEAISLIMASDTVAGLDKKLLQAEVGLEIARQAKMEIEVGKLRGELVSVEDVAKAVEKEYSFVRAQFRSIPSKLAKPLSMVQEPNEVYKQLDEAINDCLAELTVDKKYEQSRQHLESARSAAEAESTVDVSSVPPVEPGGMGGPVQVSEPGIE